MKRLLIFVVIAAFVPLAAQAQGAAASANPVSDSVRQMVAQHAKVIIAAAEEMPADKYSYHPTPQQITFGHLMMHLAQSNTFLCSATAGPRDFGGDGSQGQAGDGAEEFVRLLHGSAG
ncbi:MAG: hypothetical protein WA638_16120 [Candidatus Acidiferrales bacterium]